MMTKKSVLFPMVLGAALLAGAWALAQHDEDSHAHDAEAHTAAAEKTDPAARLSLELRQLLIREMQLIDDGMGDLMSAISAGDWPRIEAIARKIQHSFILKQRLTEGQLHELHETLPDAFVRSDIEFHATAGKLADASHRKDAELATFYFSRLVERCVGCHASFAPERFPGLSDDEPAQHRH